MIQRGDSPRFPLEATDALGICGERRRKNLDRNVAAETRITGSVHLAHAAGAARAINHIQRAEPCSPFLPVGICF